MGDRGAVLNANSLRYIRAFGVLGAVALDITLQIQIFHVKALQDAPKLIVLFVHTAAQSYCLIF
jgi:hypothetical protein